MAYDANFEDLEPAVEQESDGSWGVTVWFGSTPATCVRRYYYRTRKEAEAGDIGDDIGQRGRIK